MTQGQDARMSTHGILKEGETPQDKVALFFFFFLRWLLIKAPLYGAGLGPWELPKSGQPPGWGCPRRPRGRGRAGGTKGRVGELLPPC